MKDPFPAHHRLPADQKNDIGWIRPPRPFNIVSSLVLNPELPMKGVSVRRKNDPLSVPIFTIEKKDHLAPNSGCLFRSISLFPFVHPPASIIDPSSTLAVRLLRRIPLLLSRERRTPALAQSLPRCTRSGQSSL